MSGSRGYQYSILCKSLFDMRHHADLAGADPHGPAPTYLDAAVPPLDPFPLEDKSTTPVESVEG